MPHILIVDDDADSATALAHIISLEGFVVELAGSLEQARAKIKKRIPDAILIDLILPDGQGLEIFDDLAPPITTEVILITGYASLESSIEAIRLGFRDYLIKPIDIEHLKNVLERIPKPSDLKNQINTLRDELRELGRFGKLWGVSASMQKVYDQIARVAPSIASVFIIGESGTGKEVVALTIHELSARRKTIFLPVNCSAISPQLAESELFGHEKGSFTGANKDRKGYFEQASGGTLFLDEITEMPIDLQAKLLRVLETGRVTPVGSSTSFQTDVRILAATNRDPEKAVLEGKLREDLLYRLQVFPLRLPPLRERPEDISLLADFFLHELNYSNPQKKTLSQDAIAKLNSYNWPGNIRELKNALHRAYIMADDEINAEHLMENNSTANNTGKITHEEIAPGMKIKELEQILIKKTLVLCDGNKEKAADLLGISVKTLYNKLKDMA
ncbi:MAG: sigma-54 dependent transcriptional regulator [Methylococcaceae bacterium]|jgi:DNA-binding NtrC family response regulator